MQIAYLAYKRLDPVVRDRADLLLRLNPDYPIWIAGAPEEKEKLYAFVHAATWADWRNTAASFLLGSDVRRIFVGVRRPL